MENKDKNKKKKKDIKDDIKECTCNDKCNCKEKENNNEVNSCKEKDSHHEKHLSNETESLKERIKLLEETLLRNQAELINYKKRKDEETNRIIKYAEEDILKGFLPILDNFERAINMDDNNLEDEVSKFLEGFKLMYKDIKSLLEKFEVKEIDCLDKEFDPAYEQAVIMDHDTTKKSGIVTDVLQKGYMYKDRVLRTAMVKVNE